MKRYIIFFVLFININTVSASTVIHGIIKDAETNKPLPNANIYIKDTYIGTISNQDGHYKLEIPKVPSEIIVSYIGYETRTILIEDSGNQELNIFLEPIAIKLQGVIVYSDQEDPAIAIMKKVIANKIKVMVVSGLL